jgi:hypothetical protein
VDISALAAEERVLSFVDEDDQVTGRSTPLTGVSLAPQGESVTG